MSFLPSILSPPGATQLKSEDQSLMEAMDFGPISELLQEETPKLVPGELGRLRLMEALRKRFGESFRGNAAARGAISQFDQQTDRAKDIMRLRGLRGIDNGSG